MDDYVENGIAPMNDDFAELGISALLTRLQRAHIEKLLRLAEDPENNNAQVLAQINRFLADNGIVLNQPGQPMIDVTPNGEARPEPVALPDYGGERYDE